MLYHRQIWGTLASLGIAIGMASGVQAAEMSVEHPTSTTQFRSIEQPLGLKVGVTIGGLTLIGLELWWFLFNKAKGQKAKFTQGIQELTITVDGGYEPATVVVKVGELVRLNFLRRDPNSCLEKVLLPDFHIMRELPLNQVTAVEFTPHKPGRYPFTCGMNMFRGVVEVQG